MFLSILFSFCGSVYIELNNENFNKHVGGKRPIMVKFYSPQCGHCMAMAEDFLEASTFFKEADFGGVDCLQFGDLCKEADGYPTIKLFQANSKEGVEYKGSRNADDFAQYVSDNTGCKIVKMPSKLVDVNPFNFEKKILKQKCGFVMYYNGFDPSSKEMIPQVKEAALIFEPDGIPFTTIDCNKFNEFCIEKDITEFPTLMLYKSGKEVPFQGAKIFGNVVSMINNNCGTERGVDGLLRDSVGIVNEAKPLVDEFLATDSKEKRLEIMEKTKAIKGTELYVKTMERINEGGIEKLVNDINKIKTFMDERKGSMNVIDGMKKRYNVFRLFVPKDLEEEEGSPETTEQPEDFSRDEM